MFKNLPAAALASPPQAAWAPGPAPPGHRGALFTQEDHACAAGSGSASTAPMHLVALADSADLGRHHSHCTPAHRRWARLQCGALHLRGFVLTRRVTSLALVLALVLSVAMWR